MSEPSVNVPTPEGILRAQVVLVNRQPLLVAMSQTVPAVPVVRFHSSCVFGEAFHAMDCDCGAQLTAARRLVLAEGGILIYAWEEGRGAGIVKKLRAIDLQQKSSKSTAEAFAALELPPEPRDFSAHVTALESVFNGKHIRFASGNPRKIEALESAGFTVDRIKLEVEMTPARADYLAHKREHLGHINDD